MLAFAKRQCSWRVLALTTRRGQRELVTSEDMVRVFKCCHHQGVRNLCKRLHRPTNRESLSSLVLLDPRKHGRYPVDTGLFVSGAMDGVVKLWDTNALDVVLEFDFKEKVRLAVDDSGL